MDDFGGADGGEIAVTLVRNDDGVGVGAFEGGCGRGSASVGHLDVADIEIIVGEHGAADWADENGAVLDPEILEGFRDELVCDTVSATGTVVGLLLEVRLALVKIVEERR